MRRLEPTHFKNSTPSTITPIAARIGPHQIIGMKNRVCDSRKVTSTPVFGSTRTRAFRFWKTRPTNQHATAEGNKETASGHMWASQYASLPVRELVISEMQIPGFPNGEGDMAANMLLVHAVDGSDHAVYRRSGGSIRISHQHKRRPEVRVVIRPYASRFGRRRCTGRCAVVELGQRPHVTTLKCGQLGTDLVHRQTA